MWANLDDVVKVETALRTSLREGQERIVPSYIRDILNDAEDVSEWKPNAAMPLAVAVADAKRKDASATRLFEEARLQLNSWYDSMSEGDPLACHTMTNSSPSTIFESWKIEGYSEIENLRPACSKIGCSVTEDTLTIANGGSCCEAQQ